MRDARARDERVRRAELADVAGSAQATADGLAAIAGRVERGRAAITDATARRDRLLDDGAPARVLAQLDRYLSRLRRALAATRDELARAEALHRGRLDEVDAARQRLARARADREVIERHFAAWRTERRKLAERRED